MTRASSSGRAACALALLAAACVTTAPSPVDDRLTAYCAAPAVTARFADPDGLPALYDDALAPHAPAGPRPGTAARFVEAALTDGLEAALPERFTGGASCTLAVEILNVILPDRTRFTPLSGQKSFLVRGVLTGPQGAVLADTVRPFTVLAEPQSRGRLGGSAWRRIGNTQDLRAEALALLTDASAQVVADAFGGGRTQTGLAGRLAAYPGRVPPGGGAPTAPASP